DNAAVAGTLLVAFVPNGIVRQCRRRTGKRCGTIAADQGEGQLASMGSESGGDFITGGTIGRSGRTAEYSAAVRSNAFIMGTAAIDATEWKNRDGRIDESGNE